LLAALVGSAGAGAKLSPLVFLPLAVLLYNLGALDHPVMTEHGGDVLQGGPVVTPLTSYDSRDRAGTPRGTARQSEVRQNLMSEQA
ncbi:hypothetical protein, partial [Streptomyces sp. NPDC006267]|uniref:hypothetical protein n=1 Tax=Streptomyces sp. NPDC006267 TaxID=3157173 RepID=UPI0033B90E18